MTRRLEVEFGLKITEVTPEELGPLLDQLARLSRNGQVKMSKETERLLAAHAPPALPAGQNGEPTTTRRARVVAKQALQADRAPVLTEPRVIAALTAWHGNVSAAAKALGKHRVTLYGFCRTHKIAPAAFRAPRRERRISA